MLKTRLWMGSLLIALAILVLGEGQWFAPWYPFLCVTALLAVLFGTRELLLLLPPESRPDVRLTLVGAALLCSANWFVPLRSLVTEASRFDAWHLIGLVFAMLVLLAFLIEIRRFVRPDHITPRLALTFFAWVYLGLLPCFLLQIRWLPLSGDELTLAFAMTLFVPKFGDIGAYFTGKFLTGRVLGRHLMTPLLSPKKTWQGFTGGMLAAVGTAVGLSQLVPTLFPKIWQAAGFGLTVGLAGVFGDLAESLIKRDCQTKDASKSIPGFGGILDVIDSILFAAPVAYLWFVVVSG